MVNFQNYEENNYYNIMMWIYRGQRDNQYFESYSERIKKKKNNNNIT